MKILALPRLLLLRLAVLAISVSLHSAAARVGAAEEPKGPTLGSVTPTIIQQPTEPTLEQEAALGKLMSGATLVGHFTVTGAEMKGELPKERYELGEVKRLDSGDWLIQSRIRYGEHDVTLPLTLPIRWAGDTPVICVDDMSFPGLGTYTARVMIYRGHYAGFWTGKDHGGHLFGVIEAAKAK